jgi:hypothetical protein
MTSPAVPVLPAVPALPALPAVAVDRPRLQWLVAPLTAATLAVASVLAGWRGKDLPAQLYRVGLFHRAGLTLWDSQWYGGHWTLNYSVLFPPLAGVIGVQATEVASAAVAALAFDRLVVRHFGEGARVGSLMFAVGTLAQVAIGQLPFLLGEALALGAFWAATRRRPRLAVILAVATSLASPLAGAFLVLALASWLLAVWPRRRVALGAMIAGVAAPLVVVGVLFPGQGYMPFPTIDVLWLSVLFLAVWLALPRPERALRIGVCLYVVAVVLSFALPTPMGGNISRLADCLGAPLAVCVLWSHRRLLLAAAVVPLFLMQWTPAFASFPTDPSTHEAYFRPLLAFLSHNNNPPGRVEIVPMRLHWEAAYAAPTVPLARGWERQMDTADNPLFYTDGALNASSYRAWLLDAGVRYVALPDVPLDYAGVDEGRLVAAGVPGLRLAWRDSHWRVFEVVGGRGIVDGPGRLVSLQGSQVVIDATGPGTILVRVRYNSRWAVVQGTGCVREAAGGWTAIDARQRGRLHLELRFVHPSDPTC